MRKFSIIGQLLLVAILIPQAVLAASSKPTISDFWAGTASWKLEGKWPPSQGSGPSHIEFYNGAWYLFERYVVWGQRCEGSTEEKLGTQVRRSIDHGATWSDPVKIIQPTVGTPWECAATDGDAIFDAANGKWRFLFQCQAKDRQWNGCYAERQSADPMGPFTPVGKNPAVPGHSLWNQICEQSTDDCVIIPGSEKSVHDEGTFNVFQFDGAYYWVSFHGYDGKNGYRGIAKTADFQTWVAGNQNAGLPADAIIDLRDGLAWRETWAGGPIGAGAGSILYDKGYYYIATEIADTNLGCTNGQRWDWGLFRSTRLNRLTWQQLPAGNPFVYSSLAPEANGLAAPCNAAYGQLFVDPVSAGTYFKHYRHTEITNAAATYLYRLDWNRNLLKNGDFWMATQYGWKKFPIGSTNVAVYRDPVNSTDGNQYLATNCGTYPMPCQSGQSIYQDVPIANRYGNWITAGGKFSTQSGAGVINMAVHQLGTADQVLHTTAVRVDANTSYQAIQAEPEMVLVGTEKIRYQLYLQTPETFRTDELFVDAATSLDTCSIGLAWAQTSPGIGHEIGRADSDGWSANMAQDTMGFLQYGPYVSGLSAGLHTAKWLLAVDNNTADNYPVVRLEVTDFDTQEVLASRDVKRQEWRVPARYECFGLPVDLSASRTGHRLEFRVYWYGISYVKGQQLGID